LEASGERTALRRRHAEHCLALAQEAAPHLERAEARRWLDLLQIEHDNLRAALTWSARTAETDDLFGKLVAALWPFWWMRGYASEARGWLDQALATTTDSSVRSSLLRGAADLAYHQADYPRSRERWMELIAFGQATGQLTATTMGLGRLAYLIIRETGNVQEATARADQGLALSREIGDPESIAYSLHNCANVALGAGDDARAEAGWEEALPLFRETGIANMVAHVVNNLGNIAMRRGDFARASELGEEALGLFRQRGDRFGIRECLRNLARLSQAQGDAARARSLSQEIFPITRDLANPIMAAQALECAAWAIRVGGEPERAATLLGTAERLRKMTGLPTSAPDRVLIEGEQDALRQVLDKQAFAAAWSAGRALSMEQAIALALRD
jgi:tetratricopeptide (TPR) repeat protein